LPVGGGGSAARLTPLAESVTGNFGFHEKNKILSARSHTDEECSKRLQNAFNKKRSKKYYCS
jgi:hypothetical protein